MWFSRKGVRPLNDDELVRLLSKLQAQQTDLEERFAALEAKHTSLRGRVYALWGKAEPSDAAPAAAGSPTSSGPAPLPAGASRDELRRQLVRTGKFIPGRPVNHE